MGIPKFFRWLSERYPKVLQPINSSTRDGGVIDVKGDDADAASGKSDGDTEPDDLVSGCGLIPIIDHLYFDVNGILHGCTHNGKVYEDDEIPPTPEEVAENVVKYLDRIVHLLKPTTLIYLAIDGVAPRAKLNHQRTRRYQNGNGGEGPTLSQLSIYDKFLHLEEANEVQPALKILSKGSPRIKDLTPLQIVDGRLVGKIQQDLPSPSGSESAPQFHSNAITPGTVFFENLFEVLEKKLHSDLLPRWRSIHEASNQLQVILSGPNVPGEGEHKIMQFLRENVAQIQKGAVRPCIVGQDGDLIILGLATHIPHLLLFREHIEFTTNQSTLVGPEAYMKKNKFDLLHFGVLREYIAIDLGMKASIKSTNGWKNQQTQSVTDHEKSEDEDKQQEYHFDLERTIDDIVFLSFFVGNDFIPHLPTLDIGDEGLGFLFSSYASDRLNWVYDSRTRSDKTVGDDGPYLTHAGRLVSPQRLERFLSVVGEHEEFYHAYKRSTENLKSIRSYEKRTNSKHRTPSRTVIEAKEMDDRERYRTMLSLSPHDAGLKSVNSSSDELLSGILRPMVSDNFLDNGDDKDLKGRYYFDKFGFTPYDKGKHIALRKSYMEGLIWNLQYYYHGCCSWEWFYPYHYAPMMSDLVGLNEIVSTISFEMSEPLRPFEQLLACLPPTHHHLLPMPYRKLFDDSSPIRDFYPRSFTVDMNGKRLPWEAVALLPFIDTERLLKAVSMIDDGQLTPRERLRNQIRQADVFSCETSDLGSTHLVTTVPLYDSKWHVKPSHDDHSLGFQPSIPESLQIPLSGMSTIQDGSVVRSRWKRIPIKIHGSDSKYTTLCLELNDRIPDIVQVEVLASQLIGTIVYINYPHLLEGFVTAVSDSEKIIRGKDLPIFWTGKESTERRARIGSLLKTSLQGENIVGSGGLYVGQPGKNYFDNLDILLNVRPLKGVETTKSGKLVKRFASFELEVPLYVTSWAPVNPDTRLLDLPALLEKNPYQIPRRVTTMSTNENSSKKSNFNRNSRQLVNLNGEKMNIRGFSSVSTARDLLPLPLHVGSVVINSIGIRRLERTIQSPSNHLPSKLTIRRISEIGRSPTSLLRPAKAGHLVTLGFLMMGSLFSSIATAKLFWNTAPVKRDTHCQIARFSAQMSAKWPSCHALRGGSANLEVAHGTTTLAFVFQHGIVVAVDSRATLGTFVGSKTVHKVLPIHSHMIGTMAGGAADCSYWIRQLQADARLHEQVENGRRMSPTRASKLLSNGMYENRGLGLSIGVMICGFDDRDTCSPHIFYVDDTGLRIEGDVFAVGSGSTLALGILDAELKSRSSMTLEDAVELGLRAIRHATFRDAYSGGFINVYLITASRGWQHVFSEDLASF